MVRQVTEQNGVQIVNTSDSTSIAWMRYESDAQILSVSFRRGTGKRYEFPGITPDRFVQIKDSDSLGKTISELKKEMAV